jgi:hypothetical protein
MPRGDSTPGAGPVFADVMRSRPLLYVPEYTHSACSAIRLRGWSQFSKRMSPGRTWLMGISSQSAASGASAIQSRNAAMLMKCASSCFGVRRPSRSVMVPRQSFPYVSGHAGVGSPTFPSRATMRVRAWSRVYFRLIEESAFQAGQ